MSKFGVSVLMIIAFVLGALLAYYLYGGGCETLVIQ